MALFLSADVRVVACEVPVDSEPLTLVSNESTPILSAATTDEASESVPDENQAPINENPAPIDETHQHKQHHIKEESTSHDDDPVVEMIKSIRQECVASKKTIRSHQKDLENLQQAQQASMDTLTKQFEYMQHLIARQQEELNKQYTLLDKRQKSIDNLLPTIASAPSLKRTLQAVPKHATKRLKAQASQSLVPVDKYPEIPHTLFQWDLERCGPHAMIRNNAHSVYTTEAGWNVVIGTCPAKRFAVQITLPKNKYHNTIAIGFTHEPAFWRDPINKHLEVFFFNHTGWYMNVRKGSLCSRDHDDSPFANKLKTGDVLSCIWDAHQGTIRFLRNDIDMGIAFKGIFNHHNWQLFPAIVSYDKYIDITLLDP